MKWLTVDKPLERCSTVDAETGKRCELFAWHRDYHFCSEAGEGSYSASFWLSGFSRSATRKRFESVTEIAFG